MIEEILPFATAAFVFGLTSGLSPGPLLTLVISETLRHGRKEGMKVALAPLFTDGPVILISLYILTRITSLNPLLGIISLLGACFLGYLAYESLSIKGVSIDTKNVQPQSLKKGIMTNALNPYVYVFHFSIGGPYLLKALHVSTLVGILFLCTFFILLIGTKMLVACLVEKSRSFLKSRLYLYTMRALGIILLGFAVLFLKDAVKFFGMV